MVAIRKIGSRDIERELLKFGIPYDLIRRVLTRAKDIISIINIQESCLSQVIVLTIERYVVIPPSCGDFSQPIGDAQQAYAHSNYGCADTANLGLMVANPRDII